MPIAINFLGGPSCGKGTQRKMIEGVMGPRVLGIQMSDILSCHRSEMVEYQDKSVKVGMIMDSGGMVPDKFVLKHLAAYLQEKTSPTNDRFVTDIVLDGTMRTKAQAECQIAYMLPHYGVTEFLTFYLTCSETVLRQRFDHRRVVENRSDDRGGIAVFNNRLKEMRENLPSTASYLQGLALTRRSHRFVEISVEKHPNAIHAEIMSHLRLVEVACA